MAGTDTEAQLRAQIRVIKDFGVTQRALAERLDVDESWLSRWLKGKASPMTVPEMDRFTAYVRDFLAALQRIADQSGPNPTKKTESRGDPLTQRSNPNAAEGERTPAPRTGRRAG